MTVTLVVDSREPKSLQALLQKVVTKKYWGGIEKLPWGDCRIGDGWIVAERKTANDLLNTLSEKREDGRNRFWAQMEGITQSSPNPILIVEGPWKSSPRGRVVIGQRTTGWSVAAVQRALHEVQDKYGVKYLWTPSHQGTALTVKALLDWVNKSDSEILPQVWDGIGLNAVD